MSIPPPPRTYKQVHIGPTLAQLADMGLRAGPVTTDHQLEQDLASLNAFGTLMERAVEAHNDIEIKHKVLDPIAEREGSARMTEENTRALIVSAIRDAVLTDAEMARFGNANALCLGGKMPENSEIDPMTRMEVNMMPPYMAAYVVQKVLVQLTADAVSRYFLRKIPSLRVLPQCIMDWHVSLETQTVTVVAVKTIPQPAQTMGE